MKGIDYWSANQISPQFLPLNRQQISRHLSVDWLPSLAPAVGMSVVHWPSAVVEFTGKGGQQHLTLRAELGRSERQWKSVISWMLGVAGARHVLLQEGYDWVAPVSAFYANALTPVDLESPNPLYSGRSLRTEQDRNNPSNLMPDYLAVRKVAGCHEWALVEAKGCSSALENRTQVKPRWRDQARNCLVTANGIPVPVSRHLVVCTRVNPNAKRESTRCLQVRCWNSRKPVAGEAPIEAVLDVVSAYLFGILGNFGLVENARQLSAAGRERRVGTRGSAQRPRSEAAYSELYERAGARRPDDASRSSVHVTKESGTGLIELGLDKDTVALVEALQEGQIERAGVLVGQLESRNQRLWARLREGGSEDSAELPGGIEVKVVSRDSV